MEITETPTTIIIPARIGGDSFDTPIYVEKIKALATRVTLCDIIRDVKKSHQIPKYSFT